MVAVKLARRLGSPTAAVAALVLCAQLGGLTHGLLERHARCEHGEFIELDDDDLDLPTAVSHEAGVTAEADEHLSDGHHHCLVQDDFEADLTPGQALPRPPAASAAPAAAPEQRSLHAGRDRYRLVPKQSPPA
jgi:hypothetical protein